MGFDFGKNSMIGVGLGLTSALVGWIYSLVFSRAIAGAAQSTIDFGVISEGVKQQIQTGPSADLSTKMVGWLNGILPISIEGLLTLVFAGIVLVNLGALVLSIIPNYAVMTKTPTRRIVSIAVLGSVAGGLILSTLGGTVAIPLFNTVIALVIYFTIVAFVYSGLTRVLKGTPLKGLFMEA